MRKPYVKTFGHTRSIATDDCSCQWSCFWLVCPKSNMDCAEASQPYLWHGSQMGKHLPMNRQTPKIFWKWRQKEKDSLCNFHIWAKMAAQICVSFFSAAGRPTAQVKCHHRHLKLSMRPAVEQTMLQHTPLSGILFWQCPQRVNYSMGRPVDYCLSKFLLLGHLQFGLRTV